MTLGRIFRTVKYLSFEQWFFRGIRYGKQLARKLMPNLSWRYAELISGRLELPNPNSAHVLLISQRVLFSQLTIDGSQYTNPRLGRFEILNEKFDFGSLKNVFWRGNFKEGDNPLRRMNLAYMDYMVPLLANAEPRALELVATFLKQFEEQNNWSQRDVFRDVWNSYSVSHRLINLLAGISLYNNAGGTCDPAAESQITRHVRLCASFVYNNLERDIQYNHLLKNYVALATYSAGLECLPKKFRFLPSAIEESLCQIILPDGGHAERSPMYHALGILDIDILLNSGIFEIPAIKNLTKIRKKMIRALAIMSHPDGKIALFNDSWLGGSPDVEFFKTPEISSQEILPITGYGRIGGDDDVVIMDFGPCGPDDNPGHAHADFLSMEASIGKKRFIIDPGVPTYTAGELRDISRSAANHNGPHLTGVEPIEFWKSFRVGRRGTAWPIFHPQLSCVAPLWLAGIQTGYRHVGVKTLRWVGLWPEKAMLICDQWLGTNNFDAKTRFLISGDWKFLSNSDVVFSSQENSQVRVENLIGRITCTGNATVWQKFGQELSAHEIVIEPTVKSESQAAAIWFQWGDVELPTRECLAKLFATLANLQR